MRLVAQVPNAVPINILDSVNFTSLQRWEAGPDFMSVQIFLGSPVIPVLPTTLTASSFSIAQHTPVQVMAHRQRRVLV